MKILNQPEAVISFELNHTYTKHGLSLTFVRRTTHYIFDSDGRKYKVDQSTRTEQGPRIEAVHPWGRFGGYFFARKEQT